MPSLFFITLSGMKKGGNPQERVTFLTVYLSPVTHSTNLLIIAPGGHHFANHTLVKTPLTLVIITNVMLIMPMFMSV